MIAKLKELRKNEDGFTLIELMVVVLIIGILAAIAIPVFLNLQKEGVKASVKSDVKNTVTNVATYLASNPQAASLADVTEVQSEGNTVTVTGDWDGYTVTGSNPAIGDPVTHAYIFTSAGTNGGTYDASIGDFAQ